MFGKCPGQDTRNLRVEMFKCPGCGGGVEIFSDRNQGQVSEMRYYRL